MPPEWTQNDLLVNGIRLHYYRTGNGDKRPLVLVHGFSDNGLCWTPVARELEPDYDVIMPDMRAHGLSAHVQPGDKVDMAADLAELIRVLGLERPMICGHSMGAMITYQIGVRFPELASALVLEDPPWWLSRPDRPQRPTNLLKTPLPYGPKVLLTKRWMNCWWLIARIIPPGRKNCCARCVSLRSNSMQRLQTS